MRKRLSIARSLAATMAMISWAITPPAHRYVHAQELTPRAYLPIAAGGAGAGAACGLVSSAQFDLIGVQGGYYKNNALTDENADLRLSVIGYSETPTSQNAALGLVDYNGAADPNAPRLHGLFEPNRVPTFRKNYQRHDWNWNEAGPPPYGSRDGVNTQWDVSAVDVVATVGEAIYTPERGVNNSGLGTVAMVLYADDDEVTLTYGDQDKVDGGYVVYIANLCVDPNLVTLYQAQLANGKRATGRLPAVRNNERLGVAKQNFVTVAVRDQGPFLDPRSRKDWWQGISAANLRITPLDAMHTTGAP
jgi:hypothetical protein